MMHGASGTYGVASVSDSRNATTSSVSPGVSRSGLSMRSLLRRARGAVDAHVRADDRQGDVVLFVVSPLHMAVRTG